jgi:hypothetical protein
MGEWRGLATARIDPRNRISSGSGGPPSGCDARTASVNGGLTPQGKGEKEWIPGGLSWASNGMTIAVGNRLSDDEGVLVPMGDLHRSPSF